MTQAGGHWEFVVERIRVEDRGYWTPCWIWQNYVSPKGYGICRSPDNRTMRAHRLAYEAFVGPIPEGLTLDHLCRVRACCNPKHLEPVTALENLLRADPHYGTRPPRPKRSGTVTLKSHCRNGHEYTPENTLISKGCRRCRECKRASRGQGSIEGSRRWKAANPDKVLQHNRNHRDRLRAKRLAARETVDA
jgi:hypothetical protein